MRFGIHFQNSPQKNMDVLQPRKEIPARKRNPKESENARDIREIIESWSRRSIIGAKTIQGFRVHRIGPRFRGVESTRAKLPFSFQRFSRQASFRLVQILK